MIRFEKARAGRHFAIVVLLLGLVVEACSGEGFRLSFLDQEATLADTCRLLQQCGISSNGVAAFRQAVERHNRHGLRVDLSKFPAPESGFFVFRDLADFTTRLRTVLHWTPSDHSLGAQDTFTCFDAACVLLHGAGCGAPDFEKRLAQEGLVLSQADPQTLHKEYRWAPIPEKFYKTLAGRDRSEEETQLIFSIRVSRALASGATNDAAWRAAFASYLRSMKTAGFGFPTRFELGLGFYALPKAGRFFPDHAFVCIRKPGRLICIEKNGSPGPYVRAEFRSEKDLSDYVSWSLLEDTKKYKADFPGGSGVLVSLNDRLIGVYPIGVQE